MWPLITLWLVVIALFSVIWILGRKYDKVVCCGPLAKAVTYTDKLAEYGNDRMASLSFSYGRYGRARRLHTTIIRFMDGRECVLGGHVPVPYPPETFIVVRHNIFGDNLIERLEEPGRS